MGLSTGKNKNYHQGVFEPENKSKFKGKVAIYRSSWELKFMRWCDNNPNVLEWGSECMKVPYIHPIKSRERHKQVVWNYYPDFIVKVKEANGKISIKMIEIKPDKETRPPKVARRKKLTVLKEQQTYEVNKAKWRQAEKFCVSKGWQFVILTEKDLY